MVEVLLICSFETAVEYIHVHLLSKECQKKSCQDQGIHLLINEWIASYVFAIERYIIKLDIDVYSCVLKQREHLL